MVSSLTILTSLLGLVSASPIAKLPGHNRLHLRSQIQKREVPQEHSHDFVLTITREFLNLNNPKGIVDPVFGLLGDAAAAAGAGSVSNLECLKQETADQAFTNAKKAGDLRGMAGALLFQAIERNTGGVGVASLLCNETAVNAEINALTQHQDPASTNAGALNKAITLELAKQLAAIGADPNLALLSGTFAPGSTSDTTGAGNSCDEQDPNLGCIYSQGLLVLDASEAEISSAVANVAQTFTGTGGIFATDLVDLSSFTVASVTGSVDLATVVNGGGAAATGAAAVAATTTAAAAVAVATTDAAATTDDACTIGTVTVTVAAAGAAASSCSVITTTVAADATDAVLAALTSATVTVAAASTAAASGVNIQVFTGTLGGPAPPVISSTGDRPFSVNGDTFVGSAAALGRSCDVQHNACANAANSGSLSGGVSQCDTQNTACHAANSLTKRAALDFGTCSDPSIIFAAGLDGRNTDAFEPSNESDFNHGSALAIGVIADFICQRLSDSCSAPADVVASCTSAAAAAEATTQDQAAADVFNAGLGVSAGSAAAVTTAAAVATAAAASSVVMTITQCA